MVIAWSKASGDRDDRRQRSFRLPARSGAEPEGSRRIPPRHLPGRPPDALQRARQAESELDSRPRRDRRRGSHTRQAPWRARGGGAGRRAPGERAPFESMVHVQAGDDRSRWPFPRPLPLRRDHADDDLPDPCSGSTAAGLPVGGRAQQAGVGQSAGSSKARPDVSRRDLFPVAGRLDPASQPRRSKWISWD